MRCYACEHDNPAHSRFCNRCGAPQTGADAESASTAARASRGERRHLSVMFCDLVDSTRLAARVDPEDLRSLLGRYHALCADVVSHYDGYVAQYLGDGVLVYFGYPEAHEDDAERAIRSALEIQRRLAETFADGALKARIGIHTGLAVVDEIGSDAHRETLALGSAINVADRVQRVAEVGGVAISAATYRLTSGVFARDLGEQKLAGIDEPQRVYAVDRVFGVRMRTLLAAATPLIGRDAELDRLREAFESARMGRGRVLLVVGEPGIGKSRLVLGLRDDASCAPRLWVEFACSPFDSASAFHPLIEFFGERLSGSDDGDPESRTQVVAKGLAQLPGLDLERVVPQVLALLGLPPHELYPLPAATPERQREQTFEAFGAIVEALAKQQILVIGVEDLHWADPSTLELLGQVVEIAARTRLVLLLTARPEFAPPWQGAAIERVVVERLAALPTQDLIEALARGRPLPAAVARQIAERSDGVPFFVEQLTRAAFESELVADDGDGAAARAAAEQPAIPASLRGALMQRLDRLGRAKRVAQLAATVGREFSSELLEKLGELSSAAVRDGLARLTDAGLVYPRGDPPNPTYAFEHALLQEMAYQSQLLSDRRATHASVADALERDFPARAASEPAVVARHCAEAGLLDRAAAHYHSAGARAAARYANEEATQLLRRSLAALSALPQSDARRDRELATCLALAPPLVATQHLDHAAVGELHRRIEELADLVQGGIQCLPALLYLSRYYQRCGDLDATARVGESVLGIARESGIPLVEVVGRLISGSCAITRAPARTAIQHFERALEIAESIPLPPATSALEPDLLAFLRATASIALSVHGRFDDAVALLRAARERAFAVAHPPSCIHVLALGSVTLDLISEFEPALAWGREALALAEGRGFHTAESQARTMCGWARAALGDPAGVEEAEAGLAQALGVGFRGGLCTYLEGVAEANRHAGRYARAHELLDQVRDISARTGEITFTGRVRRARGMIFRAQGQPERARAELLAACDVLGENEAPVDQLVAATELLGVVRGGCEEASARARLATLYRACAREPDYRPQRAARALLEEVAAS